MNFYKRHLGDLAKSCGDLSQGQMGAYDLLTDWHYANEEPLPLDMKRTYRIGRGGTKVERDNIDLVLALYFDKGPDGYTQKRVLEEIAKAQESADAEPDRKAGQAERQQRSRQRRKALYESLRQAGVTPPFDSTTAELESLIALHVTREVTDGHEPVTRDDTATTSHKPLATSHTLTESSRQTGGQAAAVPVDSTGQFEGHAHPEPTPNPAAAFAIALTRAGTSCTSLNPDLVAYVRDGGTVEHLLQAATQCPGKPATYAIRWARRELAECAEPITGSSASQRGPSRQLTGVAGFLGVNAHELAQGFARTAAAPVVHEADRGGAGDALPPEPRRLPRGG